MSHVYLWILSGVNNISTTNDVTTNYRCLNSYLLVLIYYLIFFITVVLKL